jgi:CRP-like cAMP-binding protein
MSIEMRLSALRQCRFFSQLSGDELLPLAELLREESYAEGDLVWSFGDVADGIFVVVSGSLEVDAPGGGDVDRVLGPGSMFGEYGMFADCARTATVHCVEDCVLLFMEYPPFLEFLHDFPAATVALLHDTVRRLIELQQRHLE